MLLGLIAAVGARAETGRDAWLRYAPIQATAAVPAVIVSLDSSPEAQNAQRELVRGLGARVATGVPAHSAIVLGTESSVSKAFAEWHNDPALTGDGFEIGMIQRGESRYIVISAPNDRGVLYGAFQLLRRIALGEKVDGRESPHFPVRWVNQWDNLDGSIERGYGGRSIFWENGYARTDLSRVSAYGRLLASIGISGCVINNVNADPRILSPDLLPDLVRIAATLRPWGVRIALALDFASPKTIGGLDTFDPLDPRVAAWWKSKAGELYRAIPDLGGFVLKADSEGRAGPSAYGRTHADAANVVARALASHAGLLFYRGFVYDHHMDWRNLKNDRARAAYDNFVPLDGAFDSNVIVQIKNGPIDFQVREPASPLFGALSKTSEAIELQITQEYMGQARHTVFLAPLWKATLDFEMRPGAPVKALARGGIIGVANVGLDDNWLGNHLSQANLYAFGRLAWDPNLSAERIADEWTRLTFGDDPQVIATVKDILLTSWRAYENYTGPLGLLTLTDITGNHYGVNVEASEENGWGQWHRADAKGVGMDRTVASGTGFIGQYRPEVARLFESLANCPDDLLLFFHHVPYTHVLHDGKTVIQYLYDSHYEGAVAVQRYVSEWKALRGHVDEQRYNEILAQLEYQAGQALVWRDAVTRWFLRESDIPDAQGRVGRYLGRVEAEAMELQGYEIVPVIPWEAASGGKGLQCPQQECVTTFRYDGAAGTREIRVQYFDTNNGVARFRVMVQGKLVDAWEAGDRLPTQKLDGASSTRRTTASVPLRPGDEIRIEGTPDAGDRAAFDYVEIQ